MFEPMVNNDGQAIPLSAYWQMMQGMNINPQFWTTMDQMYGTGYRNPVGRAAFLGSPPPPSTPSSSSPPPQMPSASPAPPPPPAGTGGQGRLNPAMMGGRHLPVRRTLHNINTNSQELPLMMGILSAAGIDPQSALGEFRSFLPKGGRLPATVF